MIVIFFTKLQEKLPPLPEEEYLKLLSPELCKKNETYKFWEDGHWLFDSNNDILNAIQYNNYKRPMLDGELDFNISYSKNHIVSAIAKNIKVGIDVENYTPIDFNDFKKIMNADHWKIIHDSEQPIQTFFDFWTIKESISEADDRRIYANEILENKARIDDNTWQLKLLHLFENASLCVAPDKESSIKLLEVNFYNNETLKKSSVKT
ncbi:4'-phosphopantetheinyl transferase family protein [Kordia sp.]|uniref:4'-phosphopantetheinyl transferase family protein n=1 Tax=Kordia sp. TaxID=1965332 RepID=UPI003D2DD401